jgi:hypothetical protein
VKFHENAFILSRIVSYVLMDRAIVAKLPSIVFHENSLFLCFICIDGRIDFSRCFMWLQKCLESNLKSTNVKTAAHLKGGVDPTPAGTLCTSDIPCVICHVRHESCWLDY